MVRRNRLILLVLWLVFYCSFTLVAPPLLDDADSVHAEVAREMLLRHDWVTLYANGIRYLEKAPLFYWLMAISMKLLSPTTLASRLPLAFSVAGLALLSESFARRAGSARAGLYAGLITLSSFGIFIFSRINIPDVLVCLLLTLALFAYVRTESQPTPAPFLCWLFAAACALDVLTKGLIGIVFPVGIVAVHLLLTRGWRGAWERLGALRPWSSAAVFLVIALPWHVLAGLANPSQGHPGGVVFAHGHFSVPLPTDGNVHGWTWFYFVNEQLLRYLNLRVPRDYDTVPLWLFLGLILIWLLPWSAYLPAALARALPMRDRAYRVRFRTHTLGARERTNLLFVVWAALPLLFFSFSTRQEYYVLPALPPMILLIAGLLFHADAAGPEAAREKHSVGRAALVLAGFGLAAGLACVYLLMHTRAPAPGTDLASLLQQNPGDYALSFGHFLDLNAQAMGMFRLPLALTALAFGAGLPLAWWTRRRTGTGSNLLTAAAAFLFLLAAHMGLVIFSPTLTSAQLADAIRAQEAHTGLPGSPPGDLIAIHGEYESGSTLGFYLRRNDLHIIEGRSSNLWYGSFFPDAPKIFETRESMAAKWAGPQRIFLWQDPSDRERPVLNLPGPVYVIASSGGKQILSNQPAP